MSSCKGNIKRTRAQKHQNRTVFRNDLHDNSVKIKFINSIQPSGICSRCKDIIDWKIKYKKYKPLTAPKKCVRCEQKSVKAAYHTMCIPCSRKEGVCAKCCKAEEVIQPVVKSQAEEDEMARIIKALPERKRRTLMRYIRKQNGESKKERKKEKEYDEATKEEKKTDLADKINKLKLEAGTEGIEDYDSDFCDSESDDSENFETDDDEDNDGDDEI